MSQNIILMPGIGAIMGIQYVFYHTPKFRYQGVEAYRSNLKKITCYYRDGGEGSALHKSQTNFDHAIVKFGQKQVYEVLL